MTESLQTSPLTAQHILLGARMVPFAGWEMPIQYTSVMSEHEAVRTGCGVFDISHMGQLWVRGPGAEASLNQLLTNDLSALAMDTGHYTLMLNPSGGVIDDLIAYRTGAEEFFLVVNASRVDQDIAWLIQHLGSDAAIENVSPITGAIAVQGPHSDQVWDAIFGEGHPFPEKNQFVRHSIEGREILLCATGYTGEAGFELFAPAEEIEHWWGIACEHGATPCGLGARDTLRLEKGYPLNGQDLDETHTPLEAGLGFFVSLDKPGGFIGRDALAAQKSEGLLTRLVALKPTGKCPPPRAGYTISRPDGEAIGELTSGTRSPTLSEGIGMGYVRTGEIPLKPGTSVDLEIRGRRYPAALVKKPFL